VGGQDEVRRCGTNPLLRRTIVIYLRRLLHCGKQRRRSDGTRPTLGARGKPTIAFFEQRRIQQNDRAGVLRARSKRSKAWKGTNSCDAFKILKVLGTHWLKTESQSQSHGGPCSQPEIPGMVPISLVPSPHVSDCVFPAFAIWLGADQVLSG